MAHYALLDENNVVVNVLVGVDENETSTDTDGTEIGGSSEAWEEYYGNFHNMKCKRTSYNTVAGDHKYGGAPFRKNYAFPGCIYDEERDAFITPKDFPSFVFNEEKCAYEAPAPLPDEINGYIWDETTVSWKFVSPGGPPPPGLELPK